MNLLIDDDKFVIFVVCSIIILLVSGFCFGYFIGSIEQNNKWQKSIIVNRNCLNEIEKAILFVYKIQNRCD